MLMSATKISAAISMITAPRQLTSSPGTQERVGILTNPLQLLPVPMTQQVLQHSQQIRDDVQPVRQHRHPLVHLKVRPDGLVHGLEVGLDPEDLGGVEDGAVEVDVDAEGEELADLHVDLRAGEEDLSRERDLVGYLLAGFYRRAYELLEEGGLRTGLASYGPFYILIQRNGG